MRRRSGTRRVRPQRPGVAATVAVIALVITVYVTFTRSTPFATDHVIYGEFASGAGLKPGDPVRVNGVDVGEVAAVEASPAARDRTRVKLEFDHAGDLPLAGATLSILPRLAFEGNFYVDTHPGPPGGPRMRSGDTVPVSRTLVPVQLDQVFGVLDSPTRSSLKQSVHAFGTGLGRAPDGRASGADGLRRAVKELDGTLQSVQQVSRAAQGTRRDDLRSAVAATADVADQLGSDPAALDGLVRHTHRVVSAFADNDAAVSAAVGELDRTLRRAPRALTAIDDALPVTRRFAITLRPALRVAPSALDRTDALVREITRLARPSELGLLVRRLRPVSTGLPGVERKLRYLLPHVEAFASCVEHKIVPALNLVAPDGQLSTGDPVWLDFLHMAAGLAGTSLGFDGNGSAIRLGATEGPRSLTGVLPGFGQVASTGSYVGVRPLWLGPNVQPPLRPDARCTEQPLIDLTKRSTTQPPTSLKSVPVRPMSSKAKRLLELLGGVGTKAGRARLHAFLLRDLPKPRAPKRRQSVRRPARRPQVPVGQVPAPPKVPSKPGADPVGPVVEDLTGKVTDLLDTILGASKRGSP